MVVLLYPRKILDRQLEVFSGTSWTKDKKREKKKRGKKKKKKETTRPDDIDTCPSVGSRNHDFSIFFFFLLPSFSLPPSRSVAPRAKTVPLPDHSGVPAYT
jgi:hypothetical protein